ncbi:MAG: hypothetical protein H6737_09025 [Alphaproteobacteria bacterium]|nr:hypothetical protein [Alphaproteobacteria bacterium]
MPHPEHAPLPRKFVAKAPGYRDTTFDMEAAEGPYLIELQKIRTAAPRPAPPPRPTAPAPGPQLPRPSIGRDRGKDGE